MLNFLSKDLSVCRREKGLQVRAKREGWSKFWTFCKNVILECPLLKRFIKKTWRENWKMRTETNFKHIAKGKPFVYLWRWLILLFFAVPYMYFELCDYKIVFYMVLRIFIWLVWCLLQLIITITIQVSEIN